MKEKGRAIESQLILVPDEYGRSLQLTNILQRLQEQLEQQNVVARWAVAEQKCWKSFEKSATCIACTTAE
jgi:hypothetical protein